MKKLTIVTLLLMFFFIMSTVYAFAAFIVNQIKPLSTPVNLLITGIALVSAGHIFGFISRK